MQVGDLILFRDPWETYPTSHVGIYAGNNQFIHASTSRGVIYDDLDAPYYAVRFLCARRIVNAHNIPTASIKSRTVIEAANGIR